MIDRLDRRSFTCSLILHGLAVLGVVVPAWWHHQASIIPLPPPPPARPPLRLVLPRAALAPPPPLPALSEPDRAGWAQRGLEREMAEVITPRATDAGGHGEGAAAGAGEAPVRLPTLPRSHLDRALRLDPDALSEHAISREHERLSDAATLLERLMRDHLASDWSPFVGPAQTPVLYLSLTVDGAGAVMAATRLNSSGSSRLDEVIDRWLRDPGTALGLPPIQPGVPHVLGVVLYVR
jgi:hypothetical protein